MEMEVRYVPSLVFLSVVVAILASYVALNFAYSVTQAKGRAQAIWLACGAIAMGSGIWSMHFVGMLAFEMPGMEMAYDVPLMTLSIVVAIVASALALFIVSRRVVHGSSIVAGGIAMAAAIAGMHYIGMYSMRMEARIEWNVYLVLASILIALGASFAALWISIRLRDRPDRTYALGGASILMGIAISGMHYTGMIAATFVHDHDAQILKENLLVTSGLSMSVISTTLLILVVALIGSIGQRIMSVRAKEAAANLKSSETKFRRLVEAVEDYAIFMLDPNGCVTTWNSGAEAITGYTEKEAVGKHVSFLLPSEGVAHEDTSEELQHALEERGHKGEAQRVRKDGSRFLASVTIHPIFDAEGVHTGFSKVIRDITQLREHEASMRALNETLERRVQERTLELKAAKEAADVANETKSAFLANMSHEIRTPLGAVLGFSELLASQEMTVTERTNAIEIIKRNGLLLSNIINDILDLSKVEAGRLEVERVPVAFGELLAEVGSLLNLEATEKGIRLTVTSEGPIPSSIETDPLRIRQILLNIIGNAIKFTDRGSVEMRVKMIYENGASRLAFDVRDTGEGIEPGQAQRLFTPFTQADVSTTRRFGGTGLGLVLSRKLARALGGDLVLLESRRGAGSTFRITIDPGSMEKVIFTSYDTTAKVPSMEGMSEHTRNLEKLNVLLVDDSPDNQALIRKILKVAGANVSTALNGREGVEAAIRGSFDLVLMDLQMPEMDGYEATRSLRSRGYVKPIIALTAHAMKEERRKCLEGGFDEHLTKPIDRQALIELLSRYSVSVRPMIQV